MRYFFFGLLSDTDILAVVLDRPIEAPSLRAARLSGYRTVHLKGETFPVLVADAHGIVPGVLVEGLSEVESARLAFFESIEYEPSLVTVVAEGGERAEAHAFVATSHGEPATEPWSFAGWRERYKAKDLRETRLWMSLYGYVDAEEADRLWDAAVDAGESLDSLVARVTAKVRRRRC